MPFDWREFLIFAHGLRNESGESVQRTCLGRVYYYVYNLGLAKARRMNFNERPPSLHRNLWDWYQRHADPTIKQMGVHGIRMHALRLDADYEDVAIPNLRLEVQTQLARAQAFERLVAESDGQVPPVGLAP